MYAFLIYSVLHLCASVVMLLVIEL